MPRSYSLDDLLKLRNSPLVCKPERLPPVEEWMGPIPEQNQAQNPNQRRSANRGRHEEVPPSDGNAGRRPPFEAKGRSTNVPEDIVLGPPKTAFASASGTRSGTKTFDSPQRPSFSHHDDVSAKNDRSNLRDRYSKEVQRSERDGEPARDSRPGATQNRRSVKDDSDLWSNARNQKHPAAEDSERPYRRNGDRTQERDREGPRGNRPLRGFETHRRDGDRDVIAETATRREGAGRGRNEPLWYRDEGRQEEEGKADQENTKNRDKRGQERRGGRGSDYDWNRAPKADMDPEWMDAQDSGEKNHAHTQEDFERWKERMRTNSNGKPDAIVEQTLSHERNVSGAGASMAKGKAETPLIVDSSIDGFFGLWNEGRETSSKHTNGTDPVAVNPGPKISKASKFTGFFNPKPNNQTQSQKVSLPPAPPADASIEDKEGFQRILKLLDQHQQPTDETSETPRAQQQKETPVSLPSQSSQGQEYNDVKGLLGTQSQHENIAPQDRNSEFLLGLMQQPQYGRPPTVQANPNGRRPGKDNPAGLLPFSNLMISPQDMPHQTPSTGPPPGYFEEVQARDKLNPGIEKRGPPPGLVNENAYRQMPAASQPAGFPAGLQRPPGLDHLPPGYQQIQPQRQTMAPPPGFSAPSRGQNAFPPGLVPSERVQFGTLAGGRGIPPPGFMQQQSQQQQQHHPPPGFHLPFSQDGLPFGGISDGANYGQGFAQQRRQ